MSLASHLQLNTSSILTIWGRLFEEWAEIEQEPPSGLRKDDYRRSLLSFVIRTLQYNRTENAIETGAATSTDIFHPPWLSEDFFPEQLNILSITSEFRALRASVMFSWQDSISFTSVEDIQELIRFNELIDYILSQSITTYTSRKEQPLQLIESVLESAHDLAYLADLKGTVIYANNAVKVRFSLSIPQMIGHSIFTIGFTETEEMKKLFFKTVSDRKRHQCEGSLVTENSKRDYELIFTPVLKDAGPPDAIAVIARDVTRRKKWEDEGWKNANYDSLTGLPNRRMFMDKLGEAIKLYGRNQSLFALLYIDLDGFKAANDSFGHQAGDEILRQSARRISSCVRDTDIVARLGGDEITILLRNIQDTQSVLLIAQHVLDRLREPFDIFDTEIAITGSIGIVTNSSHATTADTILNRADSAMYVAKNAGKNRYFLDPDMT
jgi:diguanylate cyclase (GGDEF)-like protein/PAS domain S-box-containing protein